MLHKRLLDPGNLVSVHEQNILLLPIVGRCVKC